LILALVAQIAAAVFLGLDYSQYPDKPPPLPSDRPAASAPAQPAAPAQPPAPQPPPVGEPKN
jgi:hypothetical protein